MNHKINPDFNKIKISTNINPNQKKFLGVHLHLTSMDVGDQLIACGDGDNHPPPPTRPLPPPLSVPTPPSAPLPPSPPSGQLPSLSFIT